MKPISTYVVTMPKKMAEVRSRLVKNYNGIKFIITGTADNDRVEGKTEVTDWKSFKKFNEEAVHEGGLPFRERES